MSDKSIFAGLALLGVVLVVVASRSERGPAAPAPPAGTAPASRLPEGHPLIEAPVGSATGPSGTVLETVHGGGYTYARIATDEGEQWVAGPPTDLETGETITLSGAMAMGAFTSKALDRTLDDLVFTNAYVRSR
jgi:hypothetical protein